MRTAILLVMLLLLAGCTDGQAVKTGLTGEPGSGKTPLDNSTLLGKLSNSPHLRINSGMTLRWDFPNATRETPGMRATLIQLLDDYKATHQGFEGNFHTVAFIPVEAGRAITACAAQEKPIKSYLRYRDTGSNRFGTLTGTFEKGWYHAILITFEPSSFTLSFDADKPVRPRTLSAPDAYVTLGGVSQSGGRDITYTAPTGEGTWLAWATAVVSGNNIDGGRNHKLDVACQSNTRTTNPPGLSGGNNNNNQVTASAAGPSGAIEFKSTYTPTLTATASSATVLNAAWARLLPIPLQAADAATDQDTA